MQVSTSMTARALLVATSATDDLERGDLPVSGSLAAHSRALIACAEVLVSRAKRERRDSVPACSADG
jgi:hypothetical protein